MNQLKIRKEKCLTIGVIVPYYNEQKFIGDCIESIVLQTKAFDQVIFVDDASTDNSGSLIAQALLVIPNSSLKINKKNIGTVKSINKGLNFVTTDFVVFLSANDLLEYDYVHYFHRNKLLIEKSGVWSALTRKYESKGKKIKPVYSPVLKYIDFFMEPDLCKRYFIKYLNWFTGTTMAFRLSEVKKFDLLNPEFRGLADWFLAVQISLSVGAVFSPKYLGIVREHPQNFLSKTLTDNKILEHISIFLNSLELEKQEYEQINRILRLRVKISALLTKKQNKSYRNVFFSSRKIVLLFVYLVKVVSINPFTFCQLLVLKFIRHRWIKK